MEGIGFSIPLKGLGRLSLDQTASTSESLGGRYMPFILQNSLGLDFMSLIQNMRFEYFVDLYNELVQSLFKRETKAVESNALDRDVTYKHVPLRKTSLPSLDSRWCAQYDRRQF